MFDRFTQDARSVVVAASTHAARRDDPEIDLVHLLAALAGSGATTHALLAAQGITPDIIDSHAADPRLTGATPPVEPLGADDAEALATLGIDLDAVRRSIESTFGEGALDRGRSTRRRGGDRGLISRFFDRFQGNSRPFSAGAKRALELSLREAIREGDRSIRAEHLLLGVLHDPDSRILAIHDEAGTTPGAVRGAVEASLRRTA